MFISHRVIDGYTKEKKQTKKPVGKKGSKYHRSRIDIAQQFLQLVQKSSWRKFTLKELVFHIMLLRNIKFGGRGLAAMGERDFKTLLDCVSAIINLWICHFLAFLVNQLKFTRNLFFRRSFYHIKHWLRLLKIEGTCDHNVDFYILRFLLPCLIPLLIQLE